MSERTIYSVSDREWKALVRAVRWGMPALSAREQAALERFMDRNHDATEDET